MIFQLVDNPNTLSGKSFKVFGQSLKANVSEPFQDAVKYCDEYNAALQRADGSTGDIIKSAKEQDSVFGKYLENLNGAPAKVDAYTASLKSVSMGAKAAAFGMNVLKVAINTLIGFGIGIAISALINVIDELVNRQEKLREAAEEAASAFLDESKSIDQYKNKIIDLKTALVKGNLSQEDAYNARKELLSIQDEIIKKYSLEKYAIDLLGDSLEETTGKLDAYTQKEASTILATGLEAFNNATKEMETVRRFGSTDLNFNLDEIKNVLEEISGFDVTPNRIFGGFGITFLGDAKSAADQISVAIAKLTALKNTYGENSEEANQYALAIKRLSEMYDKANKILSDNQTAYDQQTDLLIASNEKYRNLYKQMADAQTAYEEAIASGDPQAVTEALNSMRLAEEAFLSSGVSDQGVSEYFQSFFDSFNALSSKYQFKLKFEADVDVLQNTVKDALFKLGGLDDLGILNIGNIEGTVEQEEAFSALQSIAESSNMSIEDLVSTLVELGLVAGQTAIATTALAEGVDISATALSDAKSATDSLASSMSTLSNAFAEQNQNGSLSLNTILGLIDAGYAAALVVDKETGAVTINTQAYIALAQAKIQEQIASMQAQRAALVGQLNAEGQAALATASKYLALAKAKGISDATVSAVSNIKALDAQINALNNIDLSSVVSGLYNVGSAGSSAANSISSAMSEAKSAIESLLSMTVSMLKQQYQDASESQRKYIQASIDGTNKAKDAELEAINAILDGYKKRIQAQIDLLNAQKEAHDYEKNIADQNKGITEIQNALGEIQFDDSIEAAKRRAELQEQLAEKQDDLAETQYDHSMQLQEDVLQQEMDRIEEIFKAKIDNIEKEYDARLEALQNELSAVSDTTRSEYSIRQEAISLIEGRSDEFYQRLIEWNKIYGTGIKNDVVNSWNDAYSALDRYGMSQIGLQGVLEYLSQQLHDMEGASGGVASNMDYIVKKTAEWTEGIKEAARAMNSAASYMTGTGGYVASTPLPNWVTTKYHSGTPGIGKKSNTFKDFNELYTKIKSNEVPAILEEGEPIIANKDKNKWVNAFNDLLSSSSSNKLANYVLGGESSIGSALSRLLTNPISTVSTSSEPSAPVIYMGDTIIQGNADEKTIAAIKEMQKGLADTVYSRIVKDTKNRGISLKPRLV